MQSQQRKQTRLQILTRACDFRIISFGLSLACLRPVLRRHSPKTLNVRDHSLSLAKSPPLDSQFFRNFPAILLSNSRQLSLFLKVVDSKVGAEKVEHFKAGDLALFRPEKRPQLDSFPPKRPPN